MSLRTCIPGALLVLSVLLPALCTGCLTAGPGSGGQIPASPVAETATSAPVPEIAATAAIPSPAAPSPVPAPPQVTPVTPAPLPSPAAISEAALRARIVDARNRLSNMMESGDADTVIIRPAGATGCEIKKSRELGELIDASTGESVFLRGDYWSIGSDLFTAAMKPGHAYILIHTHPAVWESCPGYRISSMRTFSLADLSATANLTSEGYHIRELIAIADREYRIRPDREDGWKPIGEILSAIRTIEHRSGQDFSYDNPPGRDREYDMDSLMPFLARELGYHYTADGIVLS